MPQILSRETYDAWAAKGESIEAICRRKATDILTDHPPPSLPANVESELERILRRHLGEEFYFSHHKAGK
jgi:trimethylamine:corrinoid methyltransferase-like protein